MQKKCQKVYALKTIVVAEKIMKWLLPITFAFILDSSNCITQNLLNLKLFFFDMLTYKSTKNNWFL